MKKIIILLLVATSCMFVSAQISHEVSVQGGGGLSTLMNKLPSGTNKVGGGGEFGIGYTLFFTPNVGINIGVDFAFYNAKAQFDSTAHVTVISPNLIDSEGDLFNMHTILNKYEEAQKTVFLNIPIMVQFQTKKFYLKGGAKIGVPIKSKFSVTDATLTNSAYYPHLDNWLTEEPEFAGLGTFTRSVEGKMPLQVSVALSLETGIKWKLGEYFALYTGIYFDYGLNNIAKPEGSFLNYDASAPVNFTNNSAALYTTKQMNVMAIGVKMRFALTK